MTASAMQFLPFKTDVCLADNQQRSTATCDLAWQRMPICRYQQTPEQPQISNPQIDR
jgi:hypothetical protein